LRNYLTKIDISKGLIILVDMGSLEEIYEGLKGIKHGVIGIINNITTQLALDTGDSIIKGLGVEEIVERATESNRSRYKLIKPTEKQRNALITTCITGIGTAVRIRDMLINSLGAYGNKIEILAYDYLKLKDNGKGDSVFTDYNVVAIVGTKNLYIEGIPFFSLEEIISGRREEQFSNVFKGMIPREGIQQIHESLLKYFSFESILNYITILNPNKIINQIEIAIESLQYALKIRFKDRSLCTLRLFN
jgi:sigma-54 dependent transcriptional regulator of gfr operon